MLRSISVRSSIVMALPSGQFKKIIYVCVISMCPRVSVNYISENCYWTNQSGGECVSSSYDKFPYCCLVLIL